MSASERRVHTETRRHRETCSRAVKLSVLLAVHAGFALNCARYCLHLESPLALAAVAVLGFSGKRVIRGFYAAQHGEYMLNADTALARVQGATGYSMAGRLVCRTAHNRAESASAE